MAQNMIEHRAAITVDAPVHQVYSLFSHFNDFPKFMSFVKEVTYYDDQRSHWVADVSGRHEWDAMNQDWIPDRQIGWRSVSGLNNYGRVLFQPVSAQQTRIDVSVNYQPPAGFLGSIGEHLGVGKHFDDVLQKDLNHFAEMVRQAPVNALDPTSSNYLFHAKSAAAQGQTTERQNATMGGELAAGAAGGAAGYMGTEAGRGSYPGQETPPNRPAMDRDITPEQGNVAPPVLDRDIVREQGNVPPPGGQQAGMQGNPYQPMNPDLPPEQIPRWENPEGGQPTP